MLYIYCPKRNVGAFELVKALGASRLRKFDGLDFWDKRTRYALKDGDTVVCWGGDLPEIDGVRVLNGLDKPLRLLDEWQRLSDAGLLIFGITRAKKLKLPLTTKVQGRLQETNPEYDIIQERFTAEYRIHSFDKRSIRAGVKVIRDGFRICEENDWRPDSGLAHPWIKSFVGGWRVNYDGFKSSPELRRIAHKAVSAVELTFGAVDVGMRSDGSLKVLEVDRAPRVEGITVQSYARAITRWVKETHDTGGIRSGERLEIPEDDYAAVDENL